MGIQSFPTDKQRKSYEKLAPYGIQKFMMIFWSSESTVKNLLSFILPLNHHKHGTETGVQYIATCLATGRSEEDASTLVSLFSIEISSTNREILKQAEVRKIKSNRHMKYGVNDNMQFIYCQLKWQATSGAENLLLEFTQQVTRGSSW